MAEANNYNPLNVRHVLQQEHRYATEAINDPLKFEDEIYVTEGKNGKQVRVRRSEKENHFIETHQYPTVSLTLATIPTSLTSSNEITFILKAGQGYNYIKDIYARIKLTAATAPVKPLAFPYLFTSIEIWGRNGQEKLQTLYPETMWQHLKSFHTKDQLRKLQRLWNFDAAGNGLNEYILDGAGSESKTFTFPLFGNFIATGGGLCFAAMKEDIWIKFFTRAAPVSAGSSSNLTMTTFNLVLKELVMDEAEDAEMTRKWMTDSVERNFTDQNLFTFTDTFTASVNYTKQLTGLRGQCHTLLVGLRPTATTSATEVAYTASTFAPTTPATVTTPNTSLTNNAFRRFAYLGKTENSLAMQIQNATGQRISADQAWDIELLKHLESPYLIPGDYDEFAQLWAVHFGDSFAAEEGAARKGWFPWTGNEYWSFTPPAAGTETAEVWTLTTYDADTGVADVPVTGSFWKLGINGKWAVGLDAAATASHLTAIAQELINDTIGLDGTPIRVVASAALSTGTLTLTFRNLPLEYGFGSNRLAPGTPTSTANQTNPFRSMSHIQVQTEAQDLNKAIGPFTNRIHIGSARTTQGLCQVAWITASYQVDMWNKIHRHMHFNRGYVEIFAPDAFA